MGRTPDSELNCSVSSESFAVPEGHPRTVRRAKDELQWGDAEGFEAGADNDQLSVRRQSIDQGGDRLGIGGGGENHSRAAHGFQGGRWGAGI